MKQLLKKPQIILLIGGMAALATVSFARAPAIGALPENALVVDVRTAMEFKRSHFEGAKNIPLSDIQARLSEFGPQNRPIVVYCRSGRRSALAKSMLENAGFLEVLNGGGLKQMLKTSQNR